MSHLLQMRGLKQNFDDARKMVTQSHLLQMRGLKPYLIQAHFQKSGVASFTDAWIETKLRNIIKLRKESHLLQMRGLKPDK